MAVSEHYLGEVQRCLDLAASAPNQSMARRWRKLADEYAVLAEQMAATETGRAPMLRMPMVQQPVQQQQTRQHKEK